jgi:amidophosphoribosyltransferase
MCGIVGISDATGNNINEELVRALTYLQHRGQDSAGIAVVEQDGKINIHKGMGLVSQVFNEQPQVLDVSSKIGVGHVRYSTQGSVINDEAQPLYTNSPYGIVLAHNGNLTNIDDLKEYLMEKQRHINTDSDSEILLNILAAELTYSPTDIFGAIYRVMHLLRGSYSVVAAVSELGLIAFRDPSAIRPLCFGTSGSGSEKRYMIASESVAFIGSPYKLERDLRAGECIFINKDQKMFSHIVGKNPQQTPCLFEYIYFARPDSVIDGISVYKARENMGVYLAFTISEDNSSNDLEIDVVIPVPETSRTYAIKLAEVLNVPYREAFVKNRYIARTFIMSNQKAENNRSKMVKMKLSTINSEFKGKNVLIVDDSIVRGTTSKELVKLAKEAGAKRIWFASAAPPICFANRLGIDIPTDEELIAHNRSNIEIAELLGCDRVFYNDLDTVYQGLRELAPSSIDGESSVDGFEISCFSE